MARFSKSNPKPGPGRPKGSINKEKREIHEVIKSLVNYLGDEETLFDLVDEVRKKNPAVLINFLARVAPKDLAISAKDAKPYVIIKLPAREIEPQST